MIPDSTTGCATLDRIDGDLIITEANAVVERVDIHGELILKAPGVRLGHFIARGGTPITKGLNACINITHPDAKDFLLHDFTVAPEHPNNRQNGMYVNQPGTILRADISGTVDGIVMYGDGITVKDSWLHDFATYATDPNHKDGSHNDAIQIQKGRRCRIIGNSLSGANNAAIMVTQDEGPTGDLLIDGNYLDGGSATVNFGSKGAVKTNLVVTNNRLGPHRKNPGMGIIRNPIQSPLVEFGNVWDTDGTPVKISRGA